MKVGRRNDYDFILQYESIEAHRYLAFLINIHLPSFFRFFSSNAMSFYSHILKRWYSSSCSRSIRSRRSIVSLGIGFLIYIFIILKKKETCWRKFIFIVKVVYAYIYVYMY
jgi:hypothetical protein